MIIINLLNVGMKVGVTAEWNNSYMNRGEDFHYLKSEKIGIITQRIECELPPYNPFFYVHYEDGKKGFIWNHEDVRIINQ
jgi:hypothetical protein